jgi:hypothetical protein
VWAAVERGDAEGCLSAPAVTTLHHLDAKVVGATMACARSPHPRNPATRAAAALTPSETVAWLGLKS